MPVFLPKTKTSYKHKHEVTVVQTYSSCIYLCMSITFVGKTLSESFIVIGAATSQYCLRQHVQICMTGHGAHNVCKVSFL